MKLHNLITISITTAIITMLFCSNSNKANASNLFKKSPKGTIENPYKLPAPYGQSVPIDITKKGNKLETFIKIEEDYSYVFQLEFRFDDPRMSKYEWVEMVKSFFPRRPSTQDELKDYNRVRYLVGRAEWENNKRIDYPGIPTPVHLIVTKIEKDGSQKVVFDIVNEPIKWGSGTPTAFHKRIVSYNRDKLLRLGIDNASAIDSRKYDLGKSPHLSLGIYKITLESLKDSPELIGTDIYLNVTETLGAK